MTINPIQIVRCRIFGGSYMARVLRVDGIFADIRVLETPESVEALRDSAGTVLMTVKTNQLSECLIPSDRDLMSLFDAPITRRAPITTDPLPTPNLLMQAMLDSKRYDRHES